MIEVRFKKQAIKDIKKLPKELRNSIENFLLSDLPKKEDIWQASSVIKLKGFQDYYRIRIGDYRIGLKYLNQKVTIYRVLHRKDIYKVFP